jgi:hypothetical protein
MFEISRLLVDDGLLRKFFGVSPRVYVFGKLQIPSAYLAWEIFDVSLARDSPSHSDTTHKGYIFHVSLLFALFDIS